jgi:hypothetical protein
MEEKQTRPTLEHDGRLAAWLLPLDQLASDPILHWILYMKEPRNQAAKEPSSQAAKQPSSQAAKQPRSLESGCLESGIQQSVVRS